MVKANSYTSPVKFYDKDSGALAKNQYFNNNGSKTVDENLPSHVAPKPGVVYHNYMF